MILANEILKAAEENREKAHMKSSADICISDCKSWIRDNDERFAVYWGLKSLQYSLGIFSDKYKRLCEKAKKAGFNDYIPGK